MTHSVLVPPSAEEACDGDVVKVYSGFLCHMSPPPPPVTPDTPLSPNKSRHPAQQTWKDDLKEAQISAPCRVLKSHKHTSQGKKNCFHFPGVEKKKINTSPPVKTIKARVVYALITFHGTVLHALATIRATAVFIISDKP